MKLVFVCTANTCRSPMAEGIFRKLTEEMNLSHKLFCLSVGIAAKEGTRPAENAVAACEEIGVDIAGHKARNLTSIKDLELFDAFVVMTQTHAYVLRQAGVPESKLYLLCREEIEDPYDLDLEAYRRCRDQIQDGVEALLYQMAEYIR